MPKTLTRSYEKHGATYTRAYRIWHDMIKRCCCPKSKHYDRYGGRGITVCEAWQESFSRFIRDMGEPPKGFTLDRKENNLGYSKENCRWATRWEQSVNRNNNVPMTVEGVTKPLAVWVKERGLPYDLVYYRKQIAGWSDDKCLSTPTQRLGGGVEFNGRALSVAEIAQKHGISVTSVYSRIRKGWSARDIVTTPNSQPYKKNPRKLAPTSTHQTPSQTA